MFIAQTKYMTYTFVLLVFCNDNKYIHYNKIGFFKKRYFYIISVF